MRCYVVGSQPQPPGSQSAKARPWWRRACSPGPSVFSQPVHAPLKRWKSCEALRNHRGHDDRVKRRRRRAREISTRSMRSYTGWCGSADYLINHVSQSSQSFGWHDNARPYNSAHSWWLLPCHQIADIIPGVREREYCNRAGNFDVEWAGCKRLWDIVRVNYRRMGLRFRFDEWHGRISFVDAACALCTSLADKGRAPRRAL